ncbi:MAG: hypothetical protein K2X66_15890 [Cyanobacteria bacterium]|nr:hypothetical protein [Cyanobacteriota bacterium]
MAKITPPEHVIDQFFKALMHNQCHVCWGHFSMRTQNEFLHWTLNDIYARHAKAAQVAALAIPEVKMLFENNDATIMKTFWKRFFYSSSANEFFRFATYETLQSDKKNAVVRANLQYPNGQQTHVDLSLVFEKGGWKFAYVESSLPF